MINLTFPLFIDLTNLTQMGQVNFDELTKETNNKSPVSWLIVPH